MRNGLRLGVFRDRTVFEEILRPDSPLIVPAHIGAYALDGLRGFLGGVARAWNQDVVDFVYDPMTYWVDLPTQYWSRGSERRRGQALSLPLDEDAVEKDLIRPTLLALLREYGLGRALFETDLDGMRPRLLDAVDAVIEFQRRGTHTRRWRAKTKYARILELAAEEEAMSPIALIAPYLTTHGLRPDEVRDQAFLNERALTARQPGEALWTIIALDRASQLRALADDVRQLLRLGDFGSVGVWVSDLDEYVAPAERLRAYREFIRSIGQPVWLLYGGYFGLLLGADGVDLVSHGIFYTESKRMLGPVGSGPPPERYYIPALHRFYEPTRAFRLMELLPSMRCGCPECPSVDELRVAAAGAARSPGHRMAWAQRLQRHFLRNRQAEVAAVKARPIGDLLAELRDAERTFAQIPAAERFALDVSIDHLAQWRGAFEEGDGS